jgi:hypothetical protein
MGDEKYKGLVVTVANWDLLEEWKSRDEARACARKRKAFEREYEQWHFSSGQFAGGSKWTEALQSAWQLASDGAKDDAAFRIDKMIQQQLKLLRLLREDSTSYDYARKEEAFNALILLLKWLRGEVKKLKVCGNPHCNTAKKYFFRVYTNDRYCSIACTQAAKAWRQDQRDQELARPPKQYKISADARGNMSEAATRRWARKRTITGRPK